MLEPTACSNELMTLGLTRLPKSPTNLMEKGPSVEGPAHSQLVTGPSEAGTRLGYVCAVFRAQVSGDRLTVKS